VVEQQSNGQSNGLIAALRPRELSRESLSTMGKNLSIELDAAATAEVIPSSLPPSQDLTLSSCPSTPSGDESLIPSSLPPERSINTDAEDSADEQDSQPLSSLRVFPNAPSAVPDIHLSCPPSLSSIPCSPLSSTPTFSDSSVRTPPTVEEKYECNTPPPQRWNPSPSPPSSPLPLLISPPEVEEEIKEESLISPPSRRTNPPRAASSNKGILNYQFSDVQAQERELERAKRENRKTIPSSSSPAVASLRRNGHHASSTTTPVVDVPSQRQQQSLRQHSLSLSELANAPLPSVATVASHGPLYDHITPTNEQLWISLCERLLSLYQEAVKSGEMGLKAKIIAYLLHLPALTLTKVRGGKRAVKRHLHDKVIQSRLRRAIQQLPTLHQHEQQSTSQLSSISLITPEHNNFSPPRGAENPDQDDCSGAPSTQKPIAKRLVFMEDSDRKEEKEGSMEEKTSNPHRSSPHTSSTALITGIPTTLTDLDKHIIKRVKRLTRTGHLRRATQTLNTTTTMADCTQQGVLAQLKELHPDLPAGAVIPALPATSAPIQLTNDSHLRRVLLQTNTGASGGPSGWGGNMLSILVNNSTCMDGLACLFQDILNNELPASIRPHLLACRLIASNKPNGSKGIRPIAIGELFYRVAATLAVRQVAEKAVRLLQPQQFGVGLSSGCERIIHALQHQLADTKCRRAALQIDISNAFNTCNRALLLDKLYNTPELQPIWRICHFAYSSPSDLLLPNPSTPSMQSRNGVRQGDPLSSLLFCLYIRDTLADPTLKAEGVQPLAFIDDGYLLGPPAAVIRAFAHLQTALPHLNLHINTLKSKFIYFHQSTHPISQTVEDALTQLGISMETKSAEVLGAVIGATTADIRDRMALLYPTNFFRDSAFFRRLTAGELSVQTAMHLLRQSGIPRLGYLLRCMAPDCIDEVTENFDRTIRNHTATAGHRLGTSGPSTGCPPPKRTSEPGWIRPHQLPEDLTTGVSQLHGGDGSRRSDECPPHG
jgi:hypothetical protein